MIQPPLTRLVFSGWAVVMTLVASGFASESNGEPTPVVSIVGNNAMPVNVVEKGARWNFGPGSLWSHRGWQYAA